MPDSKSKVKSQKSKVVQAKKNVKSAIVVSKQSEASTAKKTVGMMTTDVFDAKGKVVGSIKLPEEVFGAKVNKLLMAQAVRVYLANQRKGTASTKTRAEVQGSTRKIYRQKGTGRARHGAIRAPIFVHGGIVFGPKPRDYSLALPSKMKRLALYSALSSKVKERAITIASEFEKLSPKTKAMVETLHNLKLDKGKNILVVLPSLLTQKEEVQKLENLRRAARNIEGVTLRFANQLTCYDVLSSRQLLFVEKAIEGVQKAEK